MTDNSLGIYIHIPFCVKKCNYCDFVSGPFDENFQELYIERLCEEISCKADMFGRYKTDTVFFGGGTPSVLSEELLEKVFDALRSKFDITDDAEISIEANPGTLTLDKLRFYKSLGFNRLSMGLQSTDNDQLAVLGRIHTFDEFLTDYDWARNCGFGNINVDLMSAIPNQSFDDFVNSLSVLRKLEPEHISVYSLIIEEGTPFYNMKLNLADEDEERKMVHIIPQILGPKYSQYEISNYSLNGYECRHNVKYWRRKRYIGLGASAASLVSSRDASLLDYRYKNICDIRSYVSSGDWLLEEEEYLSEEDVMSEFMFLGLRLNSGISYDDFYESFNVNIFEVYKESIYKHINNGLLTEKNNRLFLTEKGRDLSNFVFADFIM